MWFKNKCLFIVSNYCTCAHMYFVPQIVHFTTTSRTTTNLHHIFVTKQYQEQLKCKLVLISHTGICEQSQL